MVQFVLSVMMRLSYIIFRLRYDANTNSYHNNTKVEIHVPGFGGTSSVEYLNPGLMNTLPYFHDTVKYFVDRSYKRGKTIRGAERLAAGEKFKEKLSVRG